MAEVWTIYCEHLEGETPSMIVAGDEFSLSETEATSRWLKGNPPSEVALARSGARDEMSWTRLSTTGRLAHDLIRAEPPGASGRTSASGSRPAVGSSKKRAAPTASLSGRPSKRTCLRLTSSSGSRTCPASRPPWKIWPASTGSGLGATTRHHLPRILPSSRIKNRCAASTPVTGRCG